MNNREGNRSLALSLSLSFAVSLMVSQMGFGVALFCIPLLLVSNRLKNKIHSALLFVGLSVCVSLYTAYQYKDALIKGSNLASIYLGLLFPICACVSCIVWVMLRDFSNNVLRKLVLCSYASGILGLLFVLWISGPNSSEYTEEMVQLFSKLLPSEAFKGSTDSIMRVVVSVIILMTVPFCMIFGGFQILVSEFIIHKNDENWQYNFAYMKMPNSFVWPFMLLWLIALGSGFVDFIPQRVSVIAWNLACGLSLHYFIGGLSILTSLLRRHSATLTASRVFVPVIFGAMMPGINFVVLPGLVILGVLETWIKFR